MIELRRDGDWLCIDIFNYKDVARRFDDMELMQIGNGFVIEICDELSSDSIMEADLIDRYYQDQRRIYYCREGLELACAYDPVSMGVRFATINGCDISRTMLDVNDYGVGKLPWVNSKYPCVPKDFDWVKIIESRKLPY